MFWRCFFPQVLLKVLFTLDRKETITSVVTDFYHLTQIRSENVSCNELKVQLQLRNVT